MNDPQTIEILELLGRVWPSFPETHRRATRHGLGWERCSTPFVHRESGRVVSHVGVLELPLVIDGQATRVAGIHAVATDPGHRGRGHVRRLMEQALAFVDARYQTAILTAGEPGIYRRFGFAVVPEHRFLGSAPLAAAAPPARDLSWDDPADVALLHRLLRDRAPASRVLGVTRERPVFFHTTAMHTLRVATDLEAILWLRVEGGVLSLFDVVAERIPTLAEITARVPEPFDRVDVQLSPDALGADLAAVPWVVDGDDYLMARGPFLASGTTACLPRAARC